MSLPIAGEDAPRPKPESGFGRSEADAIVAAASARYFAACRDRIEPFVDRNFSLAGSVRLHRHALGWDILRAPANALLSLPQIGLKLGSMAARRAGASRAAEALARQDLLLETAVAREIRWRMVTELLEQPYREPGRESLRDGLAEAILAEPEVAALLADAGAEAAAHRDDAAFRAKLEAALTEYAGTRAAAAEITTGLLALGTGALAFGQATPGALALGPAVAASFAQGAAVAGFPLGAWAGGLWYAAFPVQASPLLVAGSTAGLVGVAAVAAAFAGVVADPVQRRLGLHRRRLEALVGGLERSFRGGEGFVAYDLYVARLLDLSDVLVAIARAFRS